MTVKAIVPRETGNYFDCCMYIKRTDISAGETPLIREA